MGSEEAPVPVRLYQLKGYYPYWYYLDLETVQSKRRHWMHKDKNINSRKYQSKWSIRKAWGFTCHNRTFGAWVKWTGPHAHSAPGQRRPRPSPAERDRSQPQKLTSYSSPATDLRYCVQSRATDHACRSVQVPNSNHQFQSMLNHLASRSRKPTIATAVQEFGILISSAPCVPFPSSWLQIVLMSVRGQD
jgi:hypothetical protein